MTLTTRLSVFFLAALALVLAGFSAALYILAHTYLDRQVDNRLDAALNTLEAAAEFGPDGIEWEPAERRLSFGQNERPAELYWLVTDEQGKRVDAAAKPDTEEFLANAIAANAPGEQTSRLVYWQRKAWRLAQRSVQMNHAPRVLASNAENRQPAGGEPKYQALLVTAAVSLEPLQTTLRSLAMALLGISSGLWLGALFAGRSLCRRALRPVTQMAATARSMGVDLSQRLSNPKTGDELAELSGAFNGLLDRLQESFERQRRFTGDASHQLRTPLAALLGQIEVALRRDRSPQEFQRVLAAVQGQALHLRQIVEALLFLARADAEARMPGLLPIDLTRWLTAHVSAWSNHPRATDLQLEFSSDSSFMVQAQEPLLSQLLDILVENAFKYSDPGTPITLRVWSDQATVCLAVEDRGWGIAPEDLFHAFEPFYRSPHARRNGVSGVGLGLAIAERIAAALGGSIGAASEPGRGSCFTLRLTLTASADPGIGRSEILTPLP